MTALEKISGANGMIILDVAQAYTSKNYNYLIPREDSTLTVCTGTDGDGNDINLLTTQNWDGTLKNTDELLPPPGYIITAVTLASGSLKAF